MLELDGYAPLDGEMGEYDKLEVALELSDIDPVEFCFWCPDCLEPSEICRCAELKATEGEHE